MFYLEKKDEATGLGPYLKYGRKGKPVSALIDLSHKEIEHTEGLNGILVIRNPDSKRKFKIVTEDVTLAVKAETAEERDSWIKALIDESQVNISYVPGMMSTFIPEYGSVGPSYNQIGGEDELNLDRAYDK